MKIETHNHSHGMIFLFGPAMDDDPKTFNWENREILKKLALQNGALVIDTENLTLSEISKSIQDYTSTHKDVSVMIMAHAFQVLFGHDTFISSPTDYFFQSTEGWRPWSPSTYINSKNLLSIIKDGTGSKLTDLWYYSCQSSKTIEDAQAILPKGSTLITTGAGVTYDYAFMGEVLIQWLKSHPKELTTDSLMTAYLTNTGHSEFGNLMYTKHQEGYGGTYNFHPIKTIIGEKSIDLVDKAEIFLEQLNAGEISSATQKEIEEYLADHSFGYTYSLDSLKGKEIHLCSTNVGQGNYFAETMKFTASKAANYIFNAHLPSDSYIYQSDNCDLTHDQYILALAAANAYEHINHELPGNSTT